MAPTFELIGNRSEPARNFYYHCAQPATITHLDVQTLYVLHAMGGVRNSMFADSACACASMHVPCVVSCTRPLPPPALDVYIPRAGDAIHPVLGEGVV